MIEKKNYTSSPTYYTAITSQYKYLCIKNNTEGEERKYIAYIPIKFYIIATLSIWYILDFFYFLKYKI